jgi:hypothetical protein
VSEPGPGRQRGPRFLFVPVSGPGGAGEYYRALAIARGVERRWPHSAIHFLVNRNANYAESVPYPSTQLDGTPTHSGRAVIECLNAQRPNIVIFDSAGRARQLRAAARLGARRVYISSRVKTRWKGFRLRRMRYLDEHWIAGPELLALRLGPLERFKLWLIPTLKVRFLPACFEAPEAALAQAVLSRYGLSPRSFVLFCPGGAGRFRGLAHGPTVYRDAARVVAERCAVPAIVVGVPSDDATPKVITVPALPNAELMALAAAAQICVINGGSLLPQCLAQGAACVCAPIAGDQQRKIDEAAAQGLVRATAFNSGAIAAVTAALLADPAAVAGLRQGTAALGLRNGVEVAIEALAGLIGAPAA